MKREITIKMAIKSKRTSIGYNIPFSILLKQGTQYFATGRTSSRFRPMGSPHSSQIP
jgi:hypothetical protein